ncbi:MAG: hypothetical protein JXA33_09275 [Anaerolineae bacterium]|nr:hypothetical protein [Anaerolineae bacterium]
MQREVLKHIVIPKPMPKDVTLSLTNSFDDPRETVDTYWFTDTIRENFEQILEVAAQGRGQGYWIEAEYGAGKTHFLATLACLLAHTQDEGLWSLVKDAQVRNAQRRLAAQRFFPVVLSLKGQSAADAAAEGQLLNVLLREGFITALKRAGLAGKVQVTATDELLSWFEGRDAGLREAIESYIKAETGFTAKDYAAGAGKAHLAAAIRRYCEANQIQPRTSATVKERLTHLWQQVSAPGLAHKGVPPYTGLLVIIDEWEFWQRLHPGGSAEAAHDEEVLETLSFVMAKDLGLPVLTLVGSQTIAPAKLRGGQRGDRFIPMPLLRGTAEREYDIIVSHRVRNLDPERAPELNQYYDYYFSNFSFAKELDREIFAHTFPFQPRCFDVVRRVTARELPTARSGIYILHQTLNSNAILERDTLLMVSDLLASQHLNEALSATVYKEAAAAYKAAADALPSLDLDAEDHPLAESLLKTLFLWYLAYLEVPQPLSLGDLAEATLTQSDFIRNEDRIALVLDQISILPQVEFKEGRAQFQPVGAREEPFFMKFDRFRRKITDRHAMQQTWQDSLFFPATATGGELSLFGQFELDKAKSLKITHRHLDYSGEVVIASRWRHEYGQTLRAEDTHFRIVILTQVVPDKVLTTDALLDPRIAVVIPGTLTPDVYDAARDFMAAEDMTKSYQKEIGQEADAVRQELYSRQRPEVIRALLNTQQRTYRAGRVLTQQSLGIDAAQVFSQPGTDRRLEYVVDRLLSSAYPHLPITTEQLRRDLSTNDVGKIFAGFFAVQPSKAEQSAVDNFAVGLGLSRAENPRRFAPAAPEIFTLIGALLEEAGGGEMAVWRVYERLSSPPYGVPRALITLYLLSFVRHHQDPVVNLHLKPGSKLRLRSGALPPRNMLTRGNVVQITWRTTGMEQDFDVLAPTEDVWPQVLPYGRLLRDDLVLGTEAAEVERQQTHLAERLHDRNAVAQQTSRQFDTLQTLFGARLPDEEQAALEKVKAVTQADTYLSLYERLSTHYTQPEAFKEDLEMFDRLAQLAQATAEIQKAKLYLDQVEANALPADLAGDLLVLQGQLRLAALVAQPHVWPSLLAQFETFQRRYRDIYQMHHRDTHNALRKLHTKLSPVPRRLHALSLLNGVQDLGHPLGTDLEQRYQRLHPQLRPCAVTSVNDVTVDVKPICAECGLRLSDHAPQDAVDALLRDLDAALSEQLRRLKTEAIRKVLAEQHAGAGEKARPRIENLIQAIEISNLDGLVDVLDAGLVTFIAETLELQGVGTVPSGVLQRLADRYPILEEKDVQAFTADLRKLLDEAFTEARKSQPDKKKVRLSLK